MVQRQQAGNKKIAARDETFRIVDGSHGKEDRMLTLVHQGATFFNV